MKRQPPDIPIRNVGISSLSVADPLNAPYPSASDGRLYTSTPSILTGRSQAESKRPQPALSSSFAEAGEAEAIRQF
jgi:hypothetical protein